MSFLCVERLEGSQTAVINQSESKTSFGSYKTYGSLTVRIIHFVKKTNTDYYIVCNEHKNKYELLHTLLQPVDPHISWTYTGSFYNFKVFLIILLD